MIKDKKYILKVMSFIIMTMCLIFVIITLENDIHKNHKLALKGVLDLNNWDFEKDGVTSLNGQWCIYPNKLLTPKELEKSNIKPKYIDIDDTLERRNGKTNQSTYRLSIKHNNNEDVLGMIIPSIYSSYRLWINGKLLISNGVIGNSEEKTVPCVNNITHYIKNDSKSLDIVLATSNYHFRYSGIDGDFFIGTQTQIQKATLCNRLINIFFSSVLFIMGICCIWMFIYRMEDKSKLYLGILCFCVSLKTLLLLKGELLSVLPVFTWSVALKVEYLIIYISVPCTLVYLYELYTKESSKNLIKACILVSLILGFITIITSTYLASKIMKIYLYSILFLSFYFIYVLVLVCLRKRYGAFITSISFTIFMILSIISILYYTGFANLNDYFALGFFIFVSTQFIWLSMNYSITYNKMNEMRFEKEKRVFAEKLREISFTLNSTLNLQEVLEKLLEILKEVVSFDSACVFFQNKDVFKVMACYGFNNVEEIYNISIPIEDVFFQQISKRKNPLIINDIKNNLKFKYYKTNDNNSWMGIPIIFKKQIIGILTLDSKKKYAYNENQAYIALAFAEQAGLAIENATLFGKVKQLAVTDSLTNLYNRRSFFELAENEFKIHIRENKNLSIIMIDIDYFKKLNDKYGHQIGDLVLKEFSELLKNNLRGNDIIARYGGEEFIILIKDLDIENIRLIVERLKKSICDTGIQTKEFGTIFVTASFGVSNIKSQSYSDLYDLIKAADNALYEAKEKGRNCISFK